MADLVRTQTFHNLLEALAREATWLLNLSRFASRAEYEGHSESVALLSRVLEGSRVAAEGHLDFLREVSDAETRLPVGETSLDLRVALTHEREDVEQRYPQLAYTARSEGLPDIASWFETLAATKQSLLGALADAVPTESASGAP